MNLAALRERQGRPEDRAALAAAADTAPEMLTWLAADPDPGVRAAVAANGATPHQAGLLLAADPETAVRQALAARIGAIAPRLAAGQQGRLARIGAAILECLVADAATEVRAALAEAVAGLPDAPRALILRLARDTQLPVAEPILRLSPLLDEADLLALIATPPAGFTRRVIAARPGLPEPVSEAVADSGETEAITALLRNASAAIREATLDRLAETAGERPAWQAALARRPRLPAGAARALAGMLAGHLLAVLAARTDLPPGLPDLLAPRLAERLEAAGHDQAAARTAAAAGDRDTIAALLAAATGLGAGRVEAALALRSPRAIAALCHAAGWAADVAELVQLALGVPRAKAIRPNAEGGWTLPAAELQWQMELIEDLPG
jgi:uncharacterized protein (DUF2336 family)